MDVNSSYPVAVDNLSDPSAETPLSDTAVPHAQLHQKVNNAIEAIQATLGTNPQGTTEGGTVAGRLTDIETEIDLVKDSAFGRIPDNSVSTIKIQDNAVTSTKISDSAVTTSKLDNNAVTNVKIAPVTITGDKMQPGTITYTQLQPFTKIHLSRPHSTPITLLPGASPATITWTDEISTDTDALTAASPIGSTTKYQTAQSTITIPASSTYDGTYMISLQLQGLRGNFYDSIYVTIQNASNQIINTFYANSGGTGGATISSHLNHLVDLKQSYKVQVKGYNGHSASPAYIAGDLYVIKVSN